MTATRSLRWSRRLTAGMLIGALLGLGSIAAKAEETPDIPKEATSLGEPLMDVNAVGGAVHTGADGLPKLYTAVSGDPAQLVIVDLRSNEVTNAIDIPGASSSYSVVVTDDGDVYTSTNTNGHLYRLRAGSDKLEDLGSVGKGQTFAWDITVGDDGKIYGSTFPGAELYSFDPATDKFRHYGQITDASEQGRTLAARDGKIYYGTMAPALLWKIDAETGEKTQLELPESIDDANPLMSVFDINFSGDDLFVRIGTDIKYAPLFMYDVEAGAWGEHSIDMVAGLELPKPGKDGEIYVVRKNELTAWNPHTGEISGTGLRYEGRVYNYRGVGWADLDDPAWPGQTLVGLFWRGEVFRYNPQTGKSTASLIGVPGGTQNVLSVEGSSDGHIWAGGYLAGFAHVNKDNGQTAFRRFAQSEVLLDDGDRLYIGTYPDARGYSYDPKKPLHPLATSQPDLNPARLWDFKEYAGTEQDRIFDLARVGNKIIGATGPKLTNFGGALVVSGGEGTEPRVIEPISENRAVTSLDGAGSIVYAATWIYGGTGSPTPPQREGTVLAYDLDADKVLWEVSPGDGHPAFLGTTLTADGNLWVVGGGSLYKLSTKDGSVLEQLRLTDDPAMGRPTWPAPVAEIKLDGTTGLLYVKVGGKLYRVDPATGEYESFGKFPYRTFDVLNDGSIAMASGTFLYRWIPPVPAGGGEPTPAPTPSVPSESPGTGGSTPAPTPSVPSESPGTGGPTPTPTPSLPSESPGNGKPTPGRTPSLPSESPGNGKPTPGRTPSLPGGSPGNGKPRPGLPNTGN